MATILRPTFPRAERRTNGRMSVGFPVRIRSFLTGAITVGTCRDVSALGLGIETSAALIARAPVEVTVFTEYGEATAPAEICWSGDGGAGLRFLELTNSMVDTLLLAADYMRRDLKDSIATADDNE